MALRTIARFRSTRGLQLQTSAKIWQDARKVYACSYSAHASTSAGIHEEEKSETSVILSDNKGGQELENVVQLEQSKETQFKASIQVRFNYIPYILGPRYTKLKNIERVTNARIDVQHLKDLTRNADLVVNGASQESVDQAIAKIKAAFQRAEKISNLQYTHFISLPLSSHKDLVEQLRSFKMNVLNEEKEADTYVSWFPESAEKESFNASAVNITDRISQSKSSRIMDPDLERFFSDDDESSDDENELHESSPGKVSSYYFIRPETVHITVLMLKLLTDERVKVAAEVLEGIRPKVLEILDGREPKVVLRGLDCLRGRPSAAHVLAIKVVEPDYNNYLQQACYIIRDAFAKAGLMADGDQKRELMLHATLMSTSIRRRATKKSFDARKILAKYRLQDWGERTIQEVHLSQRFLFDEDGYYHRCGSFPLPSAVPQASA